jgi:hypothetical protein
MPQQGGAYNTHPAFGGFMNDPTAQLGFQMGKTAMDAGQQYMEQNVRLLFLGVKVKHTWHANATQLGRFVSVSALKHYFNVSNSYVVTKLRIILFPWWHRPWPRQQRHNPDPAGAASAASLYLPPREDINSPDMYIPTMALVTYILLATLLAGLRGAFHPELLGYTATLAICVTLLEILILRTGTFLLAITSSSQLLDLVAYSGYKFVHVIVAALFSHFTSLIGIGGYWIDWVIFLYFFSANAFFLLRSLRYVLLPNQSGQEMGAAADYTLAKGQRNRRTQFLFVYSYVVQFGLMVWLSKV